MQDLVGINGKRKVLPALGPIESKERSGTADDYLSAPLLDCEMNGIPSLPVLSWIFFMAMRLVRCPRANNSLLQSND
jgi:hypothetical protein